MITFGHLADGTPVRADAVTPRGLKHVEVKVTKAYRQIDPGPGFPRRPTGVSRAFAAGTHCVLFAAEAEGLIAVRAACGPSI